MKVWLMQKNPLPTNAAQLGDSISEFFVVLRTDPNLQTMQSNVMRHTKKRLQACFIEEGRNVENRTLRNRALVEYARRLFPQFENPANDELDAHDIPVDENETGLLDDVNEEVGIEIAPRIRFNFGAGLSAEAVPEPTIEPPLYPSDPEDGVDFDEVESPKISLRKFATN